MYSDIHTTLAVQHATDLRREACADRARALALASLRRCASLACRVRAALPHPRSA